ncbi:MAG: YkgJ family cysteine cluster protein [bacterium]
MVPDLDSLAAKAQSKKRDFKLWAQQVRKMKPQKADGLFHQLHEEAFELIDCLECANCCKGLGPRLTETDIARLASMLKMKTSVFMETYLRIDEDGDYVFQSMPCPFLLEDNYCMVYASRPKACRAYPHTHQKNIKSILSLCVKNTETCPAVYRIFEKLPALLP